MALTDSCVAYYKFDGDAIDATGNGYDGTVNGATLVMGKINQCYQYDGTDDYISLPENYNIFGGGENFSISIWFNTNDVTKAQATFLPRGENNLSLKINIDGESKFKVNVELSGSFLRVVSSGVLSSNTWYHFVVTYNTSTGWVLYKDGTQVDSNTSTGSIGSKSSGSVIGYDTGSNNNYFDGKIDELGIWNKTLSSSVVSDLYNGGDGLQYPFVVEDKKVLFIFGGI